MFEDIQKYRQAVQENIEKSFQIGFTESEDLQKAHNVGDIHPNGKWVWTQLPSGKYDWRVIKKTAQGAGNATPTPAGSKNDTQNQKTAPKSSVDYTKEDEKKKKEVKVDYKEAKSVADFLLKKFNISSKIENYSETSPTYLRLDNKGVEIEFAPKKEPKRISRVLYSSSQFDNEPVFVTILASFDIHPELKKLFDKLSSTNLKEATDGKTAQWGTWKFAIRSKEDLKKFGEIYNQVLNKKKIDKR